MIPWCVVNVIAFLAQLLGLDVYVEAVAGRRCAKRIYFMRREPGAPRLRRLAPYRSGPLTPADAGLVGPFAGTGCEMGPSGPSPARG